MKVIVTHTVFSTDPDLIAYMSTNYLTHIANKLNYKIIKNTTGKHVDCTRPHYHIMVCMDCSWRTDASGTILGSKVYKTLNEKIHRITDMEYPSKEIADKFRDTERKLSYIYQGENKMFKKKWRIYDESTMRYPFKEYDSIEKVETALQFGYSYAVLEQMRDLAHQEWLAVKGKIAKQQANEMSIKDKHIAMKEYLNKYLVPYKNESVDKLVRRTRCLIWDWKTVQYEKGMITSTRSSGIKDEALSFLKFNHYCTSEELIDYQDGKF